MNNNINCRYCGVGEMEEEQFTETTKDGRTIIGLKHYKCLDCYSVMTTAKQFEYNYDLVHLEVDYVCNNN